MTPDLYQPADCICFNLRRAARIITQVYDHALKPAEIQATQFTLLAALHESDPGGGIRLGELAELLGMDRTTLTRNLIPASRAGWLRVTKGKDRRERLVALTPAGQDKVAEALGHWQRAQQHMLGRLGPSQSAKLLNLTRQLTAG